MTATPKQKHENETAPLTSAPITSAAIAPYLKAQEKKSFLRFITCGSVDDGKSTLLGRLLYESKMIFTDQLDTLKSDSKKHGTQGGEIDFAHLADGLDAEREQGITIDVAYRFFTTEKRKFIAADTPGHEQYTRNMATGASTAQAAILLIDAREGVLTQTRRHAFIVSLLGIRHIVLAVNKMDLVGFKQEPFDAAVAEFARFIENLEQKPTLHALPVCALLGDNVTTPSRHMTWYKGETLLTLLEEIDCVENDSKTGFRMPIQWVNRPNLDFRGFCGQIASGQVQIGDTIKALPSGGESRVARIVTQKGDLQKAIQGQSVTLTLEDEIDISRGEIICDATQEAGVSDQFEAVLLWMADEAMLPGRSYLLKIGTKTTTAIIHAPKYKININTLEQLAAKTLALNEIGVSTLSLARPIAFDPYVENRHMGGFILIDRQTNNTVGLGMLKFGLRRAANIHWQDLDIDKAANASQKGQNPAILWFTGFSGSGKSTIANAVQKELFARGRHTFLLDGDNIRHGLNRDLGFTDEDRVENIRRIAEVAALMVDAGLISLVSFISPFRAERQLARERVQEGEFIEIFVDTPLAIAESRDPKGLYKKARAGQLANFTGIDSPYEPPETAEITIDTTRTKPDAAAQKIIDYLIQRGIIHD